MHKFTSNLVSNIPKPHNSKPLFLIFFRIKKKEIDAFSIGKYRLLADISINTNVLRAVRTKMYTSLHKVKAH